MLFVDVPGLDRLKTKLLQSVNKGKLPHAQLFLGPQGSGKLQLAYALAQYLYCSNRQETDSCGVCSSCRKIDSHIHPDVHYSYPVTNPGTSTKKPISTDYIEQWRTFNKEKAFFNISDWVGAIAKDENKQPNIYREETRSIISKLSLKPYEGEAKTLIIWMPEYLKNESNVLLKLIEEPPQKTYFILVAEDSDELLTTITSRTQLLKVPQYTQEETIDFLKEKYKLETTKAEQLGYLAEGNFRKANELVESVEDNYGSIFRDWMVACYTNNLIKSYEIADSITKQGRVQSQLFLTNGLSILRESLLYKTIDGYQIKAEQEQQDFIKKFSKTLNASCIEKSYEQINEVIYHIKRNANGRLALFHLSLNLRYNFVRK
jgi:DNA polymerase-3 subunit delta'